MRREQTDRRTGVTVEQIKQFEESGIRMQQNIWGLNRGIRTRWRLFIVRSGFFLRGGQLGGRWSLMLNSDQRRAMDDVIERTDMSNVFLSHPE
jgi:hypothetical protein